MSVQNDEVFGEGESVAGRKVLDPIGLTVEPGKMVALIGASKDKFNNL
jgi:ABC-type hemin transport system ATPase subunit